MMAENQDSSSLEPTQLEYVMNIFSSNSVHTVQITSSNQFKDQCFQFSNILLPDRSAFRHIMYKVNINMTTTPLKEGHVFDILPTAAFVCKLYKHMQRYTLLDGLPEAQQFCANYIKFLTLHP